MALTIFESMTEGGTGSDTFTTKDVFLQIRPARKFAFEARDSSTKRKTGLIGWWKGAKAGPIEKRPALPGA